MFSTPTRLLLKQRVSVYHSLCGHELLTSCGRQVRNSLTLITTSSPDSTVLALGKPKHVSVHHIGTQVAQVLCGHELLSRIIRFALILLSTLDPASLAFSIAVAITSARKQNSLLATTKIPLLFEEVFLLCRCDPTENRTPISRMKT